MLVVSDTTALTTLLKSGQAHLLEALFGSLLIPPAVAGELLRFHQQLPAFCAVRQVNDSHRLTRLRESVDAGEAEAICLAAT